MVTSLNDIPELKFPFWDMDIHDTVYLFEEPIDYADDECCNLIPFGQDVRFQRWNLCHTVHVLMQPLRENEFNLSVAETIALQSATEVVPHTGAFFSMACNVVLHYAGRCRGQTREKYDISRTFRDYELGYIVAKLSVQFFLEFC